MIEGNIGSVSHHSIVGVENVLYFLSERGVYSWSGGNRIKYLSGPIEQTYANQHVPQLAVAGGVFNRKRGQYLFTLQNDATKSWADTVVAAEFSDGDPGGAHVYSTLNESQGVDVIAIADDRVTDKPTPIIGTPDGFVAKWDDGTARLHRPGNTLYGNDEFLVNFGPSDIPAGIVESTALARLDRSKEGLAGVPVVFVDIDDDDAEVKATATIMELTSNTTIQFRTPSDISALSALSALNIRGIIGGYEAMWQSRWFEAGAPEKRKRWRFLDLTFEAVDGDMWVDIYKDFEATPNKTTPVSLRDGFWTMNLEGLRATWLRVKIRRPGIDPTFTIHEMTIRVEVVDAR